MALREQLVEESNWSSLSQTTTALRIVAGSGVAIPQPYPRDGESPLWQRIAKRTIDLAGASVLLVLLAPLLFVLCIAIRIDSPGPAMFRQRRLGRDGRPFRILKLRTLSVIEDGSAIRQVTKNDPRVTRLGRILRRFSIDELPQLVNVVRGDMSLVGPRPHALAHDRDYAALIPEYTLRQSVRPGITGWAQIHGCRGETATPEEMRRRVRLDLWYLAHAGLRLDLGILFATPRVVLFGRNAW
ncbi:MAG: exopolysaccharide biosynthesis polyprenyl glycosylphosphotransferase [Rhizomicrobium sp.]